MWSTASSLSEKSLPTCSLSSFTVWFSRWPFWYLKSTSPNGEPFTFHASLPPSTLLELLGTYNIYFLLFLFNPALNVFFFLVFSKYTYANMKNDTWKRTEGLVFHFKSQIHKISLINWNLKLNADHSICCSIGFSSRTWCLSTAPRLRSSVFWRRRELTNGWSLRSLEILSRTTNPTPNHLHQGDHLPSS